MQGVPQTLPDCSKRASLAEVGQFRTKRKYWLWVATREVLIHNIGW
jgi:hypothetical protein